jgi:Zn finger protein HypA/HybF involved in hydrogenase expression
VTRVEGKVFYCPKCRKQLVSKDWAAPMCPQGCKKQMKRVTTGREGVFVKQ